MQSTRSEYHQIELKSNAQPDYEKIDLSLREPSWKSCAHSIPSNPMQISYTKLIMFTNKITSFYIYDSIEDKSSKSIQNSDISNETAVTFAIDTEHDIDTFFVYTTSGKLISHNISTKQWNIISIFGEDTASYDEACSIIIGSNYHIFTVETHYIWNKTQNELSQLCGSETLTNKALKNAIIFYIANTKQCIIINGNDASILYLCSINDYEWKEYILQDIPTGLHSFGCVMSLDERYILILGGRIPQPNGRSDKSTKDIWIIEMTPKVSQPEFNVMESQMKCPRPGQYFSCLMANEDDLVVDGYITKCWMLKEFTEKNIRNLSMDVMKIIKAYFGIGSVHLFDRSLGNHFKMGLTRMLP